MSEETEVQEVEKKKELGQSRDNDREEPPSKKVKSYSAKDFRNELKLPEKNTALQKFLSELENDSNQQCALHFLKSGGTCLEILQTMESDPNVSPVLVFEIVNYILLRIKAKHHKYQSAAHDSCRYVLNTYVTQINKMLGLSSSKKERVTVLKLLTTIVTFSASLAKDVLLHVNFNPTNMELIIKVIEGQNDVRAAFIQFLTSFLVNGHYLTLSVLLEQKGLLTSVVSGLKFDKDDVVVMFLTALKNHVLENPSVSKTVKMKTFSTPVVRDIVNLYNWKGPMGIQNLKRKRSNVTFIVDDVEKSRVNEAVHSFLSILCTSHKFGVIFRDHSLGLGKKNQNGLMYTVLESLHRPWEHSYARELVLKIIGACPDLAKTMWTILIRSIEPSPTLRWLKVLEFAIQLLDELPPTRLDFCINELTTQQVGQIICVLILPMPVIKAIVTSNTECDAIKYHTTRLLLKMADSAIKFIDRSKCSWSNNIDSVNLTSALSLHVTRIFPDAKTILTISNPSDATSNELQSPNQTDVLRMYFDLFKSYQILAPRLLDSLALDLDIGTFLEQIRHVTTVNKDFLLEIKIMTFFLELEPTLFAAKTPLFQSVFIRTLEIYYNTPHREISQFLRKLLTNLGIFDNFDLEIGVLIDGVLNLEEYDPEIATNLIDIIRLTDDQIGDMKFSKLSPFFVILSQSDLSGRSKCMKSYLKFVLLNFYHLQGSDSSEFLEIVSKINLPSDLRDYFENWEHLGTHKNIKFKHSPILKKFNQFSNDFLSGDFNNFDDYTDYPDLKLNLFQSAIFFISRLQDKKNVIESLRLMLVLLIEDKYCLENPRFLATLLEDNTIISNLAIIKSEDHLLTPLMIEVIKKLKLSNYSDVVEPYLNGFRMKMVSSLFRILKKPKKYPECDFSLDLFETIHLDYDQCSQILIKIIQIDDMGSSVRFHQIVSYCLDRLAFLCANYTLEPLTNDVMSKLESYFCTVAQNVPQFHTLASHLLSYLKIYPHSLHSFKGTDLFFTLINLNEFHKDNVRLCEFLLLRRSELVEMIEENLDDFCDKKGYVLSLLGALITICSKSVLEKIYSKLEPAIQKALQKPHKASQHFHNFYKSVGFLIDNFTKDPKLGHQVLKFEISESFHAFLLRETFRKVENKNEKIWTNMIVTFMHLLTNPLKKFDQIEKIREISLIFSEFLDDCTDLALSDLAKTEIFTLFSKLCLKYGISGEFTLLEILKKLSHLCLDEDTARLILDMMLSHSEFLDVILGDQNKLEIFELWLLLCTKWPQLMERNHVPVLLSSYNGTNRSWDQINLKLLEMYESKPKQTNFFDFKPFLWGKAAATYYSIRSDIQKVLWRQPKFGDILDNLHENLIVSTIINPNSEKSYDLKFFLPLFGHLLAPENQVYVYRFTKSGGLSLTITGFCNDDKMIRLMSCHVLSRFRFHLEAKVSGKDTLLWQRFLTSLCKGVALSEDYKLNNFSAIYLSKMALILTQPLHVMYVPLTMYLSSKSDLDFAGIPELYTLLHSPEVDFREHRTFILEIIRDGLRSDKDITILFRSMAFKLISELLSSSLCDVDSKVLILEIYFNCISLKLGLRILCGNLTFLTQMHNVIVATFESNRDKEIDLIISKTLEILGKVIDLDHVRHRNLIIYLSTICVLENDKVFGIIKQKNSSWRLYKIFLSLIERYPDFFKRNNLDLISRQTGDQFCNYLRTYGCQFFRDEDFISCSESDKNLRMLVCKLLKVRV